MAEYFAGIKETNTEYFSIPYNLPLFLEGDGDRPLHWNLLRDLGMHDHDGYDVHDDHDDHSH